MIPPVAVTQAFTSVETCGSSACSHMWQLHPCSCVAATPMFMPVQACGSYMPVQVYGGNKSAQAWGLDMFRYPVEIALSRRAVVRDVFTCGWNVCVQAHGSDTRMACTSAAWDVFPHVLTWSSVCLCSVSLLLAPFCSNAFQLQLPPHSPMAPAVTCSLVSCLFAQLPFQFSLH